MLQHSSIIRTFLHAITCWFYIHTRSIRSYCPHHNLPFIAWYLCYYIPNVCRIIGNTMFVPLEQCEHHVVQINPLLINKNILMTNIGQVPSPFPHNTLHRVCMMPNHHGWHTVYEEYILYIRVLVVDLQYKLNDTNPQLEINQLASIYQTWHNVAIVSRTQLQRLHASFAVLLILPLLLPWDDYRYDLTPCLCQVPNHQQNKRINTVLVDNLEASIPQLEHNDWTCFLNCTYWQ